MEELTKEAKGLEEILRNQAHPKNLVAVKKVGHPSPGESSRRRQSFVSCHCRR